MGLIGQLSNPLPPGETRVSATERQESPNAISAERDQLQRQIRLVLTWADQPRDLDAHLEGPLPGGERFHVHYNNQGDLKSKEFVNLDVDDRDEGSVDQRGLNMIYTDPGKLGDLRMVILDEVHYLQDRYRGPVWEEVIIHLPGHVRLVCLSATVSNTDDLADWISTVRGPIQTVVELERPVELEHLYPDAVGGKDS